MSPPKKAKKIKPDDTAEGGRLLRRPRFTPPKLRRQVKRSHKPLPSSYKLFSGALGHVWKYRRLFGGIIVIYFLLTLVLVKGLSGSNLGELKGDIESLFEGQSNKFSTGLTLFGVLLSNSRSTGTQLGSMLQTVFLLVISLAVIWMLRQTYAAAPVRLRDAFYRGMYPLVPFVLIILVIGFQLIPLGIANFLLSLIFGQGIAVTVLEKIAGAGLLLLLAVSSFYMVTSSILALYIVTLPEMTPLKAMRTAKGLVHFRRWTVMRKLLFLPLIVFVIFAAVTLPLIIYLTPAAEWVFLFLAMGGLILVHSYVYRLYRELI